MRLAIAFGLLGLTMIVLAMRLASHSSGAWCLVVGIEAYLAACFLSLAGVYASREAGVDVEGILAGSGLGLLLRVILLPYLGVGVIALFADRMFGRKGPFQAVAPSLYVGRLPFLDERGRLKDAGIDAVLNLCCEFPRLSGIQADPRFETALVPILDGSPPTDAQLSDALDTLERWHAAGRCTLIHCAQGHGRTSTIAAAALIRLGIARTVAEALEMLAATRPGARPSASQRAALVAYVSRMSGCGGGEGHDRE
ncbi:protein-tyrosine phosphatase family protein [Aquisphaera insulae]|uniref:protein-tyrosine phosphatase family protein n=1 Tax=Aquisphaera insulae TaxID=2712864 RepID=UPI0013E9AC94|nr:dual specificity protein phosphatase family protein [Aquisphaera insulae]